MKWDVAKTLPSYCSSLCFLIWNSGQLDWWVSKLTPVTWWGYIYTCRSTLLPLGSDILYDRIGKEKHHVSKTSILCHIKRRQYFGGKESQHFILIQQMTLILFSWGTWYLLSLLRIYYCPLSKATYLLGLSSASLLREDFFLHQEVTASSVATTALSIYPCLQLPCYLVFLTALLWYFHIIS